MKTFRVIAFTHKQLSLDLVGRLHLAPDEQAARLPELKEKGGFSELMFLSTCNRVELIGKLQDSAGIDHIQRCIKVLNPSVSDEECAMLSERAEVYEGTEGINHVLKVISSLESMVVGEREIITQFRKAYDFCNSIGITGDFIRLVAKTAIQTAKEVYTNTGIARNPVSVASLAYRQLRALRVKNDSRILFVGSGETNTTLANYFRKHEYANFTVFNRTILNAEKLANVLKGRAFGLESLNDFKEGFDVLVVCTASAGPVITASNFENLLQGETGRKVVIDLGIPANVEPVVAQHEQVSYIDIASLRALAEANHQRRRSEIVRCEEIVSARTAEFEAIQAERKVELAFGEVPKQVRAIRELAVKEVFARDISELDPHGKEVLEKVLAYIEKKYNAVAIKTAKEVMLAPRERA